MKGKF